MAQTLNESLKLTAADAAEDDEFGFSVALDGAKAVVGAPYDDDLGDDSGSVYVRSGQQMIKLNASDGAAGDRFGWSVATSGSFAVVGAPYDNDHGFGTGSAYVFDLSTGQELFKLTASDADATDYFGTAVAIDGNIALIGADGTDAQGAFTGSVYVFDSSTGQEIRILNATLGATMDHFGASVGINGNTAVIGAYGDGLAASNYGAAYIFDIATGQELHKLLASDPGDEDQFGYAVAISGSRAVVGAWRNDDAGTESGSAYIYNVATGQELHKLTASDASGSDYFGRSVSAAGSFAAIGAPLAGVTGGAYIFDMNTGDEVFKLFPSDVTNGAWAGRSVSMRGSFALAGAHFDNDDTGTNNTGSAFVFDLTPCTADLNNDGVLDFFDISAFLTAFTAGDPVADFTGDGTFDFFDISAFLTAFSAGCP